MNEWIFQKKSYVIEPTTKKKQQKQQKPRKNIYLYNIYNVIYSCNYVFC